MARDIQDLNNVDAPDSDYPYGRVKDISSAGAGDGTPVNEMLLGDVIQFFNKLMDEGGITANGLPDNNYTGFQFYEALQGVSNWIRYKGVTVYADGNDLPLTNISSTYYSLNLTTNYNELEISANPFADNVVSFGDSMPLATELILAMTNALNPINIVLNSTNAGSLPVIRLKGITASNQTIQLVENETVRVVRMNHGWMMMRDTDT